MKLKKFFAGVLAAAMMLTVGATAAFATEPAASTITVPGSGINDAKMLTESDADLALTKTLKVENGTAPDSMTFNFTVKNAAQADVATPSVEFKTTDNTNSALFTAGTYTSTFNVNLATILGTNKTKVGEYTYTISENDTQIPGITKDNNELTLKVTVVNATGEIGGSYGYYAALYRGGKKIEATDAFKNSYDSKSLTLSKTVHGALADLKKDFTFTIKFTKDTTTATITNEMYRGPQVGALGDNVSIKLAGNETTPLTANTYLELDKPYTVSLRHNGSLELSNLPAGIKYEVFEDGSEVSGSDVVLNTANTSGQNVKYVVTVKDADQNAVSFSNNNTVSGQINKENPANVTTAFHNTNNAEPDMGVVLDNAPYIAMLAIVAIGGVALMLNKRRRDEE